MKRGKRHIVGRRGLRTPVVFVLAVVLVVSSVVFGRLLFAAADPVLAPIGNHTTNEGSTLTIQLVATDTDPGDTLAFTVQNAPEGAAFTDHGNRTATFAWTPNTTHSGVYPDILFSVTDGTVVDAEAIVVTVEDGLAACTPNWSCSDWTACDESAQYRICDDELLCGTETGKPAESQSCDSAAPIGVSDLGTVGSCPGCTPPPVCGDLVCAAGENCSVCAQDCGSCPVATVAGRFGSEGGLELFSTQESALGVGASREIINWATIEQQQDVYTWTAMDDIVQTGNALGIDVVGHFIYTPTWAEVDPVGCTSNICAITDMNEFRQFAHDVAERYDGNHGHGTMRHIEILNEVTIAAFFDLQNTDYPDWLIAGYEGVKAGNPNAQVLIGGFVNPLDAQNFVQDMLENYDQYYDIVSYHVYDVDSKVNDATEWLRDVMELYGVDKPMWLTETATMLAPTNPGWQHTIAKGVVKRFASAFGNGAERAFWWLMLGNAAPEESQAYGITDKVTGLGWVYPKGLGLPETYHPRQAYQTYRMLVEKLDGFRSVEKISSTEYRFTVNARSVYILWCDGGSCTLPTELNGAVTVTDYLGNQQARDASTIALDGDPIIVE